MAGGGAGAALLLLLLSAAAGSARGWAQVLLREVQTLTLHRGQYATSRRTAAVPQLQCTGGSAWCSRATEVVQCYSDGWDGYNVQWQCKADLENTHCFRQIEVSCEGYDYPGDPYILRGSCSLLFRLELTEEGERNSRKDFSDSTAVVIVIIVILVLAYGVYKFFLSNQQPQQMFGDGDGFTHPSWQNHQAPPPPGFEPSFTGDRSGTWSSHENSSGPGFWTGLGAGGLLGYLAGSHSMWPDPAAAPPMYGQSSNSAQGSSTGTRSASERCKELDKESVFPTWKCAGTSTVSPQWLFLKRYKINSSTLRRTMVQLHILDGLMQ
uniref:Store-operated calcium entry-associated regulatory factor n=1 Tax=Cairina moschata TaxID=8855 RepID=A0A8C3BJE2_CAIMO